MNTQSLKDLLEIEHPQDGVYDGMCRSPAEMARLGLLVLKEGDLLPFEIVSSTGAWYIRSKTADGRLPLRYYMFYKYED